MKFILFSVLLIFSSFLVCDCIISIILPIFGGGGSSGGQRDNYVECIIGFRENATLNNTESLINLIQQRNGTVLYNFIDFINAIAVNIKQSLRKEIESSDSRMKYQIKYVVDNTIMQKMQNSNCTDQMNAGWCLARISNLRQQPNIYRYPKLLGNSVPVYVIDTGANINHPELAGKVTRGGNYARGEDNNDNNGHGTATSSLVCGSKVGDSKSSKVVAIKVLNRDGRGNTADIIAGVQEAVNSCRKIGNQTCIINLSLGGGFNLAMNVATNKAFEMGCFPVVAAGNSDVDACTISPASARNAFTIAASNRYNTMAYFTNYGPCVKLIAPGQDCDVAQASSNGYTTMSGTSFSAPYTAGVAALNLAMDNTLTPKQLGDLIIQQSSNNTIDPVTPRTTRTPNRFLRVSCNIPTQ